MMTAPPSTTCWKRVTGSGWPFLKRTWIRCTRQLLISISPRHSIASPALRSATTSPWSDRMSQSDRKTILIVDDTPTNIGIISAVLKDFFRTKADDEKQGFEVGAVDYIHKPFSAPIVLARVNTHIALRAALQQAHEAQKQADELLHCLLPEAAAEEIRNIGTVIPRRYEGVAVLFCDVVNFTSYCDKHEPEEVVSRLDALFIAVERVAAAHGLEKIKTIGDAFMAAAGLLRQADDPLGSAVLCGLEMATTSIDAQLGWAVRVGVHVGPVVAGIVGQERYQFDIWGDTVNIAARMASKAMPGSVAVTDDIWTQIKDRFESESLGELEIKGKGIIPVVAVRREKPRS